LRRWEGGATAEGKRDKRGLSSGERVHDAVALSSTSRRPFANPHATTGSRRRPFPCAFLPQREGGAASRASTSEARPAPRGSRSHREIDGGTRRSSPVEEDASLFGDRRADAPRTTTTPSAHRLRRPSRALAHGASFFLASSRSMSARRRRRDLHSNIRIEFTRVAAGAGGGSVDARDAGLGARRGARRRPRKQHRRLAHDLVAAAPGTVGEDDSPAARRAGRDRDDEALTRLAIRPGHLPQLEAGSPGLRRPK